MTKYYREEDVLKAAEATDSYVQIQTVKTILEDVPPADVVEKRRGEWIEDKSYSGKDKKIYYCSLCNHWQAIKNQRQLNQIMYMNYCPFCGAEMKKPQNQIETFGFDERVVNMATSIAIKKVQRPNPRYISALLKKWHDSGLKTYLDVKSYEGSKKESKK